MLVGNMHRQLTLLLQSYSCACGPTRRLSLFKSTGMLTSEDPLTCLHPFGTTVCWCCCLAACASVACHTSSCWHMYGW
jgi:hypothetical protein